MDKFIPTTVVGPAGLVAAIRDKISGMAQQQQQKWGLALLPGVAAPSFRDVTGPEGGSMRSTRIEGRPWGV